MHLKPDAQSYKCDYCQSVYFPEKNGDGVRVLDEPSGQDCPLCKLPLMEAVLVRERIRYCTRCGGMLLPMPELEDLIDELRSQGSGSALQPPGDPSDLNRKLDCPQCHSRMDAHFYCGPGNVVVDSCDQCFLIWMDRGKLMHIASAPDPQRDAASEWESPEDSSL